MADTIWPKLAAPLPNGAVQHREGPRGIQLAYIDWPFIQSRLDEVCPGEWTLTLEPIATVQGGEEPYACKATLTIQGVTRENIGTGKDWKDAATDASKRAAVRFGIGLELYEKGAKPAGVEQRRPPQSAGASASTATPAPASNAAATEPSCPKCGGKMFDNRAENDARAARGEKLRPDWKCRQRTCDGVIWRPKGAAAKPVQERSVEEIFDGEVEYQDTSLPF